MSQFISKENVHEATDVPRIRSLMANAERLGEVELVKTSVSLGWGYSGRDGENVFLSELRGTSMP